MPTLVEGLLPTDLAHRIQSLSHGRSVWLVGGALRDHFFDLEQPDLDFAVEEGAVALARRLADEAGAACFVLDDQRDAARVILPSKATLDFARLRAADIESDLQLRDFTMNALAVALSEPEQLIDPLGGLQDIKDRVLRACAPQSIGDDPIRTLRAVRLSTSLTARIDDRTVAQIRSSAPMLGGTAAERRRDELSKMLKAGRAATALRLLRRLDLLPGVLPEHSELPIEDWKATLHVVDRLADVVGAIANAVDSEKEGNLPTAELSLRLGRFREQLSSHLSTAIKGGHSTDVVLFFASLFIDHPEAGYFRARGLRYSESESVRVRSMLSSLTRVGDLLGGPSDLDAHRYFRASGASGVEALLLFLAKLYAQSPPQNDWEVAIHTVRKLLSAWFEDHSRIVAPPRLVRGDELAAAFDLDPGPQIGRLLEGIAEGQVQGKIDSRDQAFEFARRMEAANP